VILEGSDHSSAFGLLHRWDRPETRSTFRPICMRPIEQRRIEERPEAPERLTPPLGFETHQDHVSLPMMHVQSCGVSVQVLLTQKET
jgi:hypothetical protein